MTEKRTQIIGRVYSIVLCLKMAYSRHLQENRLR